MSHQKVLLHASTWRRYRRIDCRFFRHSRHLASYRTPFWGRLGRYTLWPIVCWIGRSVFLVYRLPRSCNCFHFWCTLCRCSRGAFVLAYRHHIRRLDRCSCRRACLYNFQLLGQQNPGIFPNSQFGTFVYLLYTSLCRSTNHCCLLYNQRLLCNKNERDFHR